MKLVISFIYLFVYLWSHGIFAYKLHGPVYVVTPSTSRPLQIDESRSAPFYYHNWMRRMDSPQNTSTIPTTTETHDLIFAEFESGNAMEKSLRKLLEKEKFKRASTSTTTTTRTTTTTPKYLPEEIYNKPNEVNHGFSKPIIVDEEDSKQSGSDSTDYISVYNNYHSEAPAPVYLPSTTPSTTTTTTITTVPAPTNLESVWNIINYEKQNENNEKWQEVPLVQSGDNGNKTNNESFRENDSQSNVELDDNFSLPGFSTNPGNGGENESRAIRVEPTMRFPYINLKPFQLKNMKPLYSSNKKENNNMFTSLDHLKEIENPVRGEAQDLVPMRQPIDRYNPAQPYLPPTNYGSKQSSPASTPVKTFANLVPPPPPPTPKITDNNFPSPVTYDSFPPYSPLGPAYVPPAAPPAAPPALPPAGQNPPINMYLSPTDNTGIQASDDDSDYKPVMDTGYQYKPPSTPQTFLPTLPSGSKPFKGYNYDKPSINNISPPAMDIGKPDLHGYHYDKPDMTHEFAPINHMETPDFHGYHYNKPDMSQASPPDNHPPDSYNDNDHDHHDTADYPELIYNKPHGGMDDTKGGNDIKSNVMGMMQPPPPPPPQDMKPDMDAPDDHGFPHDFPSDFKYNFDEHDHDFYHHHHHPTTTTTTTEMPRVNRYSYYYLGKKLYYLPLYFSVYFIVYVGALIIKAVLRHKIVYPNSWRPNDQTASFFSKRSVDSWDLSQESLHEITDRVTRAIGTAAEKYINRET